MLGVVLRDAGNPRRRLKTFVYLLGTASESLPDSHEDIGASIQARRVAPDLAVRLNCPYCHKPDTNDH